MLFDGYDEVEDPCMSDGTGLADALLGLSGFRVLEVRENPDELVIEIETTVDRAACARCGTWAEPHERKSVEVRDLPFGGRFGPAGADFDAALSVVVEEDFGGSPRLSRDR